MKTKTKDQADSNRAAAALVEMERYCAEHPRSPSALRRPRIFVRGETFVALLSSVLHEAISGIGGTVDEALEAFDLHYRSAHPVAPRLALASAFARP
jgi:hypothetical protein